MLVCLVLWKCKKQNIDKVNSNSKGKRKSYGKNFSKNKCVGKCNVKDKNNVYGMNKCKYKSRN